MALFHLRHFKNVKIVGANKYALNFASTHSTPKRRAVVDAPDGGNNKKLYSAKYPALRVEGQSAEFGQSWLQLSVGKSETTQKEVGRNAGYDKPGIKNKLFTLHMKNIPLSPILFVLVLMTFFSCTKDPQTPTTKDADLSRVVSMVKDKEGILHLTVSTQPFQGDAAKDRDGCTMYEAIRFTKANCSSMSVPPPNGSDDRVTVDTVRFRLVKINKSTNARTALTNYITATNVGGLNVSWFDQSPLSDYWYATEFDKCGPTSSSLGTCSFFSITDFWGDDYLVQLDPWDCDNRRAADFDFGPLSTNSAKVIVRCALNENCTISSVPFEDPCYF